MVARGVRWQGQKFPKGRSALALALRRRAVLVDKLAYAFDHHLPDVLTYFAQPASTPKRSLPPARNRIHFICRSP
jgi:hypothetical protein